MLKIFLINILIAISVLLSSCATIPEDTPPDIKWPMPPARPRIQFIDYISGSADVTAPDKGSMKELIFGESKNIPIQKPTFLFMHKETLYVSDLSTIDVFDFKNNKFRTMGKGYLKNATGIVVLKNGSVYVGDSVRNAIYLFSPGQDRPRKITRYGLFKSVGGISANEDLGRLYVADTKSHSIKVLDLQGNSLFVIGNRGQGHGEFNYPYDIKVGPGGRLYIVDSGNFRVQVLDSEGNFLSTFGSIGTMHGQFARPKGIALDPDNNIYVIDSAFSNFQIFNQHGQILLAVGGAGIDPGMHILPLGIFIDNKGRIYISEQGNNRIQIYQYISYADEKKIPPPPLYAVPTQ